MVTLAVLVFAGVILGFVIAALLFLSHERTIRDRTDARYRIRYR